MDLLPKLCDLLLIMPTSLLDENYTASMSASTATPSTQLPLSNISRLMKASLPATSPSLKLSSPTKTMMQDIVSEFILFITAEAQERAEAQRRSTLNGDDILYALEVLGFRDYERVGKVWLSRHRIVSPLRMAIVRGIPLLTLWARLSPGVATDRCLCHFENIEQAVTIR